MKGDRMERQIQESIKCYGPETGSHVFDFFHDEATDEIYANARIISADALLKYWEESTSKPKTITNGCEVWVSTDVLMRADPLRAASVFDVERRYRETVLGQTVTA